MYAAFCLSVFLSAFLLFLVQPLISKAILPWFGGSPGVWTTCMLVFQWLLLGGYLYAHVLQSCCSVRWRGAIHVVVLLLAVLLLPVLPESKPAASTAVEPTWAIVGLLLTSVGMPFFVLSSNGPLMQAWAAQAFPQRVGYRLYALSNTGSLLALLAYPFVVEPLLSVPVQGGSWSGLFVVFSLLCGMLTVTTCWRVRTNSTGDLPSLPPAVNTTAATVATAAPTTLRVTDLLLWFALSTVPSVMLLATTNQICLDVASVPFLWVLPLALYLISFILCFDSPRWYRRDVWMTWYALSAVAMTVVLMLRSDAPLPLQVGAFLAGLFGSAMVCHGELARRRPHPQQLTLYFLVISAGGAAGGTFVSLLAPRLFLGFYELQLAIVTTALLVTGLLRRSTDVAGLGSMGRETSIGTIAALPQPSPWRGRLVIGYAVLSLGLLVGLVLAEAIAAPTGVLNVTRNFYGVLRVRDTAHPQLPLREFVHGRIIHGSQFAEASRRRQPTTYYGSHSGIGIALRPEVGQPPRKVGVIGLGVGTLAAYGQAGEVFRFYEIDPDVETIARRDFTFLSGSPAACEVVIGDARLVLEQELARGERNQFDVLVLDAFSGDAIPTHLLSIEAMDLYQQHLAPGGLLAIHVSNRHLDLQPVVASLLAHAGFASRLAITEARLTAGVLVDMPSIWVLASSDANSFTQPKWQGYAELPAQPSVRWTDSFSSLAAVLKPASLSLFGGWTAQGQAKRAVARALQLLGRDDLAGAEAELQNAIQLNPAESSAWIHLGNTLRRKGDFPGAVQAFAQGVELAPGNSSAHNNLGALIVGSDPQRAEYHFQAAIRNDSRNAGAFANLGNLRARQGQYDQAIECYETALSIDPNHAAARQNLTAVKAMR